MRRIVVLAIVLGLCAPLSACGSSAQSPHTLRGRIVAAALAQKSVHWTLTTVPRKDVTLKFTADVNADSGRDRVTIPAGDVVETRLVNDTVYFRGGYEGGLFFLDLTPAQADSYAGRWISIPRGYRPHRFLAEFLTLGWIVRHAVPHGPLKKSFARKSDRTRLLVLRGDAPDTIFSASRLTVRARGDRLPAAFSRGRPTATLCCGPYYGFDSNWSSGRFSKWNEPLNIRAPANSTPIATVRG